MHSDLYEKFKESAISVVPVMLLVVILNFTIAPLNNGQLPQFLIGGALLISGLAIFLLGAEIGMVPFGQKVGSSLTYMRKLALILIAAFAIGFAVTVAEPDVQVLATQVNGVLPSLNKSTLLFSIAVGVGFFVSIGILRVVFRLPLGILLIIAYILVFLLASQVDSAFVAIAFDSGGATTGPVTVPFIMAMGIGIASTFKKKEDDDSSFGLVGLASIGPIAAVAMMGFLNTGELHLDIQAEQFDGEIGLLAPFFDALPHVLKDIFMALVPILLIFIFFQVTIIKLSHEQLKRMILGFFYTYLGLVLFMTGVIGGFSPAGQSMGMALGSLWHGWAIIPVGFVLGAVVVCAEPAVWILTEQVETLSGGHIRRSIMLGAMSLSISLAVVMGMIRVATGISIWYFLIPGYLLALLLTRICPPLFTAIAFDSGGVASGPMSTTFVLSLTLGASMAVGGNPATDAFGMVAMIAMAPLVTIQILGLIFKYKSQQHHAKTEN